MPVVESGCLSCVSHAHTHTHCRHMCVALLSTRSVDIRSRLSLVHCGMLIHASSVGYSGPDPGYVRTLYAVLRVDVLRLSVCLCVCVRVWMCAEISHRSWPMLSARTPNPLSTPSTWPTTRWRTKVLYQHIDTKT